MLTKNNLNTGYDMRALLDGSIEKLNSAWETVNSISACATVAERAAILGFSLKCDHAEEQDLTYAQLMQMQMERDAYIHLAQKLRTLLNDISGVRHELRDMKFLY